MLFTLGSGRSNDGLGFRRGFPLPNPSGQNKGTRLSRGRFNLIKSCGRKVYCRVRLVLGQQSGEKLSPIAMLSNNPLRSVVDPTEESHMLFLFKYSYVNSNKPYTCHLFFLVS